MSRSSIFECVAILDLLNKEGKLSREGFQNFLSNANELSVVLYSMIKKLSD